MLAYAVDGNILLPFHYIQKKNKRYILDQHAVDERIGLETLQREVLGPNGDERNFARQHISSHFKATPHECKLLELYAKQLADWGFSFSIDPYVIYLVVIT